MFDFFSTCMFFVFFVGVKLTENSPCFGFQNICTSHIHIVSNEVLSIFKTRDLHGNKGCKNIVCKRVRFLDNEVVCSPDSDSYRGSYFQ